MAPSTNAILRAYHARVGALRDGTADRLEQIWYALPNYRDSNIDEFLGVIEPIVEASKQRTVQLTSAYHQQMAVARGETPIPTELISGAALAEPRGVPNDVVYRRPANSLYTALADGLSVTQSVDRGATRLKSLATTDLQLVKTKQSQLSLQSGGYRFYRRVLNGNKNCALCVIASTQRYHIEDLLPIHPGCQCTVDTVKADFDPGQVIDDELLEQVHALISEELGVESDRGARDVGLQKLIETPAGETKLADYTELIFTRQHGEYGPTLSFRSHEFQERFLIGLSGPTPETQPFGLTNIVMVDPTGSGGTLVATAQRERISLNRYTGDGYKDVNVTLRANPGFDPGPPPPYGAPPNRFVDDMFTDIQNIDAVMARSTINQPVTVYRGTSLRAFGDDAVGVALGEDTIESLIDMTFRPPAYVSTSRNSEIADLFLEKRLRQGRAGVTGNVRFEIRLQPGDLAIDLDALGVGLGDEAEILLNRDQLFRVVDAQQIEVLTSRPNEPMSIFNLVVEPVRN